MLPNQGIRRSAFNGLVLGLTSALLSGLSFGFSPLLIPWLIFWPIFWLIPWLISGLIPGPHYGLSYGLYGKLAGGLSLGLLAGLFAGGLACLRHYVLRFLLWRNGSIPWHYVPFLDSAAERILLRKVGGGYIFLHRLLLDYFADLETEPGSDVTGESRQEGFEPETMPSVSVEPTRADEHTDVRAISLSPTLLLSDVPRLLPCGHELRTPSARFCSVCGQPIRSSSLD